jgi:hypothetical protein
MTDPTGGSIAQITTNMLKGLHQAQQTGGLAGLTAQIEVLAGQLGTSTAAVTRGIAVAAGSTSTTARSLANFLAPWVQQAIRSGTLTLTETVVATAPITTTGLAAWWAGLAVGAKVVVVVAAVGIAVLGAKAIGSVLGSASGDDPIESVDRTADPFTPPGGDDASATRFVGVGAYADGTLRIVSVRSTAAVADGIPWCEFRHGGIDCSVDATLQTLTKEYDNAADATTEVCGLLGGPPSPPPLAAGYQAPYGSGFVTVDDWGSLDFEVCAQVTGG